MSPEIGDAWLKRLALGGSILVVGGLILAGLAEGAAWARALGLVLAGLGVVLAFLPGAIAGYLLLDPRRDTADTSLGTAVRLWSAVMIAIGLGIAFYGLAQFISPDAAARFAHSRAGLGMLLVLGGSAVGFYNLVRFLGLQAREPTLRASLALLPGRFSSLAGILLGLFLIFAGLVQLLAPDLPGLLLRELLPPLPTPPA